MRKIFDQCIAIENNAEQIYRMLSVREAPDNPNRKLWEKLADDEAEHARILEMAQRLLREGMIAGLGLSLQQVTELLGRIVETRQMVQRGELARDEMIMQLIEMERQMQQVHTSLSVEFANPDLTRLFSKLGRSDGAHFTTLQQLVGV